jgi:hypothetical protein
MEISISFIGLAFIILAWLVQIGFTIKLGKAMRPCFAGLQFIGISLLVFDGYKLLGEMTPMAWMNATSAVAALIMLILVLRK